jgi:energy-coupling factor transporter ATP-binding protein EcfA2
VNSSIVEIRNICFSYNGHEVLQDVNLDIRQGDFIAMIAADSLMRCGGDELKSAPLIFVDSKMK